MKKAISILMILLFGGCSPKPNFSLLIQTLDKAVQQNYYFYTDGPAFTKDNYIAALNAISKEQVSSNDPASDLIKKLDAFYKEDPTILRHALNALLKTDDKRRNYYIDKETANRLEDRSLDGGAGIVLFREAIGRYRIVDVLEGSAAHLAQIPALQMLEKIDNQPVNDLELEDVVALIRGKAGTSITLTVNSKDYSLVRGAFSAPMIRKSEWNLNNKRILYIEMRSAAKGAARELEAILMKSSNPDSLVLDLRKLNMGDFDESFTIADLFLGAGTMGLIRKKAVAARPMSADANVIYSGKTYVLVSNQTSPHVKTIAMALRQSNQVQFIGPDMTLIAYAGNKIPIQQQGYAVIIDAVIEPAEDQPRQLSPEITTDDYVPVNPPPSVPDPADPAHAALLRQF